MNRLQGIADETPLFVTLNPHREIDPDAVLRQLRLSASAVSTPRPCAAQQQLWSLQGQRNTWFCGAYFGAGFHEDGLQAGLAVAEALGGVRRPWTVRERIRPHPSRPCRPPRPNRDRGGLMTDSAALRRRGDAPPAAAEAAPAALPHLLAAARSRRDRCAGGRASLVLAQPLQPVQLPRPRSRRRDGRIAARARSRRHLREAGIETGGPIRLLTMPRILGYAFNPLSVYFCHRRDARFAPSSTRSATPSGSATATSFPFQPAATGRSARKAGSRFYVSPFMSTDMTYSFVVIAARRDVLRFPSPATMREGR